MKFDKYYSVYDKYSIAQKKVAVKLLEHIKNDSILEEKIESIFEIGCGTGIFTKEYRKVLPEAGLILNDIFNTKSYISEIDYNEFIEGDIEKIEIPKTDIIFSSSVLQWIKNFESLVNKISIATDRFCFSIYVDGNLIEIKNHFSVSLNYYETVYIKEILEKYFKTVKCYEETIKIDFENPMDLLKHLKYTGVTGFQKETAVGKIRNFKDKTLTYEVAYFVCSK